MLGYGLDGLIDMAIFIMKIAVHHEEKFVIEAESEDRAQDIANELWADLLNSIDTFTLTPINKLED